MADTLYDIAESLRKQILGSSDRRKVASEFFSSHGQDIAEENIIVLDDGTPVIKDDPGRKYDKAELQKLKNSISEQLELFSDLPLQSQSNDGNDIGGKRGRKRRTDGTGFSSRGNPILRDGVSAYYTPEKGWSGKEQPPWTVKGAWDKFGFVNFLGMKVRNVHDIAQMFSIYRNPMIEYFHIILEKEGRIVHQIAMTSGLSGLVRVIPSCGVDQLKADILKYDFDAAYLVHNHPSGDPSPSDDDIRSTAFYVNEIFKGRFLGHIILDHDRFTLISAMKHNIKVFSDIAVDELKYTPHSIKKEKPVFNERIHSPNDIARLVFDTHNEGNVIFNLDNEHMVRSITPFDIDSYDPVSFMYDMKDNCVRDRALIVTSEEDFNRLYGIFEGLANGKGRPFRQPILDCLYIDLARGTYKSMLEHGYIEAFNWQSMMAKGLIKSDFIWDEDISDHPTQGYLFEKAPSYSFEFLEPSWKERDNYTDDLASYDGKGSITVLDTSDVLETIGYPPGKVIISENAIRNARNDSNKNEVLNELPTLAVDPAAVIDTGAKTGKDSRNCLLFACNMLINWSPATVGLLVEPVESKRKTEYIIQAVFSPKEMSRDDNRLYTVCAANNQFLYSDKEKPCFIIPRTTFDKPPRRTEVDLPNEIPHRKAVLNHQADKTARKTRQETRRN